MKKLTKLIIFFSMFFIFLVSFAFANIEIKGNASLKDTLLLDNQTNNIVSAFSYYKVNSNYTGSCIRVRRSSDNTEQDIGFVNNTLDTASLNTFVGAGDGFIVRWYDQSGKANRYLQQTNSSIQTVIVSSSVIVSSQAIYFSNSINSFYTANNAAFGNWTTDRTIIAYAKANSLPALGSTGCIWSYGAAGSTYRDEQIFFNVSQLAWLYFAPSSRTYAKNIELNKNYCHSLVGFNNGTARRIWINDVMVYNNLAMSAMDMVPTDVLWLGALQDGTAYQVTGNFLKDAYVYSLFVFNKAMTDTEINDIRRYLDKLYL
jgi:hypothetical protein